MDYEKAYKEALELMKDCIPDGNGFVNIRPCDIFPELAESEDERIRKRIIHALHGDVLDMEETKKAIAWLEKQGEQKQSSDAYLKGYDDGLRVNLEMQGEQKSAWSEVDKDFMYDTLSNLTELKGTFGEEYCNIGKCIEWLKSLKDRVQPQTTWKPSDEQMDALRQMLQDGEYPSLGDRMVLTELYGDLKKLKEE